VECLGRLVRLCGVFSSFSEGSLVSNVFSY
jgi:hypothetical protein